MKITEDAYERAKKIRLVIFDVDGVLTDGGIYMGESGELFKSFHCHDGFGITVAHRAGLQTAILTGRQSICTLNRAKDLNITAVKQGSELKAEFALRDEEIAYVADDIIDLPVLVQVGFRAAVGDAKVEVKERAHFVAENCGGRGAVREVLEFILKAQGKWSKIIEEYTTIEG